MNLKTSSVHLVTVWMFSCSLGAEHDGEGNSCPDAVHIMARKASGKPTGYKWSRCSRNYIRRFLRYGIVVIHLFCIYLFPFIKRYRQNCPH